MQILSKSHICMISKNLKCKYEATFALLANGLRHQSRLIKELLKYFAKFFLFTKKKGIAMTLV